MKHKVYHSDRAPKAIGPYSQAVGAGGAIYISGQIATDPATMQLVTGGFEAEARRAFENLKAVAEATGASLAAAVRVTVYLIDLANFQVANQVMAEYFAEPYPARVTIGVAALPRGAAIEVDCILVP